MSKHQNYGLKNGDYKESHKKMIKSQQLSYNSDFTCHNYDLI